jgi:hypothetical protein
VSGQAGDGEAGAEWVEPRPGKWRRAGLVSVTMAEALGPDGSNRKELGTGQTARSLAVSGTGQIAHSRAALGTGQMATPCGGDCYAKAVLGKEGGVER